MNPTSTGGYAKLVYLLIFLLAVVGITIYVYSARKPRISPETNVSGVQNDTNISGSVSQVEVNPAPNDIEGSANAGMSAEPAASTPFKPPSSDAEIDEAAEMLRKNR